MKSTGLGVHMVRKERDASAGCGLHARGGRPPAGDSRYSTLAFRFQRAGRSVSCTLFAAVRVNANGPICGMGNSSGGTGVRQSSQRLLRTTTGISQRRAASTPAPLDTVCSVRPVDRCASRRSVSRSGGNVARSQHDPQAQHDASSECMLQQRCAREDRGAEPPKCDGRSCAAGRSHRRKFLCRDG